MHRRSIAFAGLAALLAAELAFAHGSALTLLTVRAEVRPSAAVKVDVSGSDSKAVDSQQLLDGLSFKAGGVKPIVVLDALSLPGRAGTVRRINIDF